MILTELCINDNWKNFHEIIFQKIFNNACRQSWVSSDRRRKSLCICVFIFDISLKGEKTNHLLGALFAKETKNLDKLLIH